MPQNQMTIVVCRIPLPKSTANQLIRRFGEAPNVSTLLCRRSEKNIFEIDYKFEFIPDLHTNGF